MCVLTLRGDCGEQTDCLSFVVLAVRLSKVILRCDTERSAAAWFGVRGHEGE